MAPLILFMALHRMAKGVAVVERFPQARFFEVLAHHRGLDRDGARNKFWKEALRVHACAGVTVIAFKDHRVMDESGFDDFCRASNDLCRGQGIQALEIHKHRIWLMKGANEVLAGCGIDTGFAADGRINHGQ